MAEPVPQTLQPTSISLADKPDGAATDRKSKAKSQLKVWEDILHEFGDPLTELAKIAFNTSLDVKIRKDALKEVVQYGHSKRRSVEITGADGAPLEVRLKMISDVAEQLAGKK